MTLTRIVAVAMVAVLAACGGGDPSATDKACDTWNDLLTREPPPQDDEVATELRSIDLDGVDDDVSGAITAVAARLESGDDVSSSYERLSGLCD